MDPLRFILRQPMPIGKLAKCQMLLSEFDIVYIAHKVVKEQDLADLLAESPVDEDLEPLRTPVPDEGVLAIGEEIVEPYTIWRLFFDGAVNYKEYETCILGLRMALNMDINKLLVIGDSDLLIHQVQGEWDTKNDKILPYVNLAQRLCKKFKKIEFRHMPRAQNEFVDALATIAPMIQHPESSYIDVLEISLKEEHAHCSHMEVEPDDKPWYNDIKMYLEKREYPEGITSKQKKTIRRMANSFFLNKEILYKRTPDLGLLRCVDTTEATKLLEEVYAGTYGPHMNGFMLAKKILREGYYWMTMESDCCKFVQKCHQFQIQGDLIKVPPSELNAMSSPWPFVAWGMHVIGPIEPASSNGHRFILVSIDYFTK
ncbi:uncharacterized protein LOC132062437 [Lycium ferocissimum]|uniref:uncharacterized protein LOC132062437 n=1 Tax=Lycium ferocissimum TaxID=112874 RepID=UPI00281557F2|nr:uncharacterized protein LOC132062437 [Lycium ferocissimum]